MKIFRRTTYGIPLFGLILLAGFLLREGIQENFVMPVALLLWILNRVFSSVDQVIYWIGLILVILFITVSWFSTGATDLETRYLSTRNSALENMNQWRTMILSTRDQTDEQNFLKQKLASLLRDVYASKQSNLNYWQIHDAIEQGEIPLPDSLRTFLMLHPKERATFKQRLRHTIQAPGRWVRHWTGQDVRDYYAFIEEVIAFLEKKLESEDDE